MYFVFFVEELSVDNDGKQSDIISKRKKFHPILGRNFLNLGTILKVTLSVYFVNIFNTFL